MMMTLLASHPLEDLLQRMAANISAFLVIAGILWWLVWPRVRDYIRRELIEPVQESHRMVATNGHKDPRRKTMIDRLLDIEANQVRIEEKLDTHILGSDALVAWGKKQSAENDARFEALEKRGEDV